MLIASHCYVGSKPCGCKVAAVVDAEGLEKETAKSVAQFIKDGLAVERIPIGDARIAIKSCKCKPTPKARGLFK